MNLRTSATLPVLLLLLVLTACGSGTATSQSTTTASNITTTITPRTTVAPTTTTPPATTASHGPPLKNVTFDITTSDGYKAALAVRWYPETPVSESSLFKWCHKSVFSMRQNADTSRLVMFAVVAEVTAQFPQTAGFTWPATKTLSVAHGDGVRSPDPACFDRSDNTVGTASGEIQLHDYEMSPAKPSVKIMWVRVGEKTPKNPEGTPKGDPKKYQITPSTRGGSCTASDKGTAEKYCFTTFGE